MSIKNGIKKCLFPIFIIWSPNLEIIKAGLKLVVLLPDN